MRIDLEDAFEKMEDMNQRAQSAYNSRLADSVAETRSWAYNDAGRDGGLEGLANLARIFCDTATSVLNCPQCLAEALLSSAARAAKETTGGEAELAGLPCRGNICRRDRA